LRRVGLIGLFICLVAVAGLTAGYAAADVAAEVVASSRDYAETVVHVTIRDSMYNPEVVTVKPGTTVVWTNRDGEPHNVYVFAAKSNGLEQDIIGPLLRRGQTFAITFHQEGQYEYTCDPHPWMAGTVIVQSAAE